MNTLSQRSALTPALDTLRHSVFRIPYAARDTLIRWCLAFANFLERGQARAITRSATAKRLGPPTGIAIPPPTFPCPERAYLPLLRAPPALFLDERAREAIGREQATEVLERTLRSLTSSGGREDNSTVSLGHLEPPIIRVSDSELWYEDFDDAPTAVYHAMPTIGGRPGGAHRPPAATRREMVQGDVRITSK